VSAAIGRWIAVESLIRKRYPCCGILGLLIPFNPEKDRSLNDNRLHFPDVEWTDQAAGSHAFFHRHDAPKSQAGHFHVFQGELHLGAIALNWQGLPVEILMLNRWVTGERWQPAAATWEVFRAWSLNLDASVCSGMDASEEASYDPPPCAWSLSGCPAQKPGQAPESVDLNPCPSWRSPQPAVPDPHLARCDPNLAGGWIANLIRSLEPELRACLRVRDRRLAEAIDRKPGENVLEDRSLEVLSRCKVRWAERLDWINPCRKQSRN
jgi:hypothetical protein